MPYIGFALILSLFFIRYILGFAQLGGTDSDLVYLPWQKFLSQHLSQGHLPQWNPLMLLGRPVLGEVENALLYPPRWLLFFNPSYMSLWFVLGHLFFSMVGFFKLCLHLGNSKESSYITTCFFLLNGIVFHNLYLGHHFIISTSSYFPWVTLYLSMVIQSPSCKNWSITALLLMGTMLAGSPQLAHTVILSALAFVLVWKYKDLAFKPLMLIALALVLATIGVSAQIVETFKLVSESTRSTGVSAAAAQIIQTRFDDLIYIVRQPNLAWLGRAEMIKTSYHIGLAPIVLFLFSAKRSANVFLKLLLLTLVFTLIACATPPALFDLYRKIPGASQFRIPTRLFLAPVMFICLGAAYGWDVLKKNTGKNYFRCMSIVTVVFLVHQLALGLNFLQDRLFTNPALRQEIASKIQGLSKGLYPRVALNEGPLWSTWLMPDGIENVVGHDNMILWRYAYFGWNKSIQDRSSWEQFRNIQTENRPLLSLYAAPFHIQYGCMKQRSEFIEIAKFNSHYCLYTDPMASSKLRYYTKTAAVADKNLAAKLVWEGIDPTHHMWYEGQNINVDEHAEGFCTGGQIDTDTWDIKCQSSGSAFVWISQAFYPDWHATVNGTPTPLVPAHVLFQAVPIPAGESHVELKFYSKTFWPLTILFGLIVIGLLILTLRCPKMIL